MNLSKWMKTVRQEARLSACFPVTHLNSPTIFETQSGFLGSTLRLCGVAFELEEASSLNHQQFLLHQALLNIDERFIVYVTMHRKKSACALKGEFKSAFARELNARYHQRFQGQHLYANDFYLTLVLKGDTSSKSTSVLTQIKSSLSNRVQDLRDCYRDTQMDLLHKTVKQLCANLSSFGAQVLGTHDADLGYSELMQFLSLWTNAGKTLPFQQPVYCAPIASSMPQVFKEEARYPKGHLGQYLSCFRLLFGEAIQFQGNVPEETCFGAMLSLKHYPAATTSVLLDSLLSLDCELIATHTFAPMPKEVGLKSIGLKRAKLANAGDKARSQMEALSVLEDEVAGFETHLGLHHHGLMLLSDSLHSLNQAILEASKRFNNGGMVLVKETLGMEPAFWSQIPGNQHFIARASLITSWNFVDFCPLHNLQTGFVDGNFLGEAVTLLETPSRTPVFFNYHSRGSKTNPGKGHAAVFGGNNAGKTTLENFLDAQMGRYNNRSFTIDRDESSKIYILASGNSRYIKISPTEALAMNPLQLPDTPENRSFLKSWLGALMLEPWEISLPSEIAETINDCIDYAYEALAPQYRSLSHVSQFLPIHFPRWSPLRRWLKGNDAYSEGEFHWLFDNQDDALNLHFDKVGFDVTFLIDQMLPHLATPVYLYLLHRMRQCLDGRLTSFVLAEAWQLFASPFWEKCLKEWLPTIRKKNGHFIFDTQSPQTITNSPIKHIVLDNLATLIVFPNPLAERETYIDQLKLTEREYQVIKEYVPESRVFLYKQGNEAILCKLDLSDLPEYIRVLSGNTKSVQLLDGLLKEWGTEPAAWLPQFLTRSGA